MDNNYKVVLIIVAGLLISTFLTLTISNSPGPTGRGPGMHMFDGLETVLRVKVFISTLNVVLIGALLLNYVSIYRDIPNKFTLSLIIFSMALLLYAISSNPLIQVVLGFRGGVGLGPFTFLSDLFASVAIITLLYQSHK